MNLFFVIFQGYGSNSVVAYYHISFTSFSKSVSLQENCSVNTEKNIIADKY